MTLYLMAMTVFNIVLLFVRKIEQISIAKYLGGLVLIFVITYIVNFLIGMILVKTNEERNMIWFLFGDYNIDYDVQSIKEYVKLNVPKLVVILISLASLYLLLKRAV